MQDSILYIVNEVPSIDFIMPARKEFGQKMAVVVLYEYVDKELHFTKEEVEYIGKIYSIPQFYYENIEALRALSNESLRGRLDQLSQSLGIDNCNLLISHDRVIKRVSSYRKSLELQVMNLMLVEKVVTECELKACFLGYGFFFCEALMKYCELKGIPNLSFYVDRFNFERMIAMEPNGHIFGMKEAFGNLRNGCEDLYSPDDLKEADNKLKTFLDAPKMPYFTLAGTRSVFRAVRSVILGGVASISKNIQMAKENVYDNECGRIESSFEAMGHWPAKFLRMAYLQMSDCLCKNPDLSERYIYLPLHFSPEITDMYYGRDYDHHEGFVFQLSKRIPAGYRLYVKEHPAMLGKRPLSFYKKLNELYNVTVVHPSVSTYELIRNGVTLVVTGTAGWEAYLMNRPSIVLGDTFFNFLPGVLHLHLFDKDFSKRVESYLESFVPDDDERVAAMRAGFVSSPFVGKGIDWTKDDIVAAHAIQYTKAHKELYNRAYGNKGYGVE